MDAHPRRGAVRGCAARVLAAAVALAAVAGPLAGPAGAAPAPSPAPTPGATADPDTAAPAAAWSVQPSGRGGPGNRPFFSYDLAPGGTVTDHVGVTNLGTAPVTLTVYGSDAYNTTSGGFDLLPADRPPTDVGGWIRLAQTTVTVPARSRADIPFTLTVPANATPGDHAGGIVASVTSSSADARGHATRLEQRVGSRVYLRVNGPLRPSLRVDDLKAAYSPGWHPGTGELTLTYTVRNTGNTRTAPTQAVRVEGLFGLPVDSSTLDPLPELLPGGVLRRTVTLSGQPAALRLSAAVSVAPDPGAAASSSAAAWALSWWYLLVPVLAAGTGWLLWRRRTRRPGTPGGRRRTRTAGTTAAKP
ncbi:DUF916 domain-containing protein [Polymorphospora sp. NPDC051019]|uniref:WxL protein peptidoglycan domain-containing protein n=1 Tax=Polymorphospora sp. NPDC051019 TaxID=3155725 RepID=UPI003436B1BF